MFDSFSRTVSRNFVRNLIRDTAILDRRSAERMATNIHGPIDYMKSDPFETYILYVDGHSCVVESETLYDALLSLPEKQRKVLLLDFWQDLTDEEIAEHMRISTRTVYNHRQCAYRAIKEY